MKPRSAFYYSGACLMILLCHFLVSVTTNDDAETEWKKIPNPCLCKEFRCRDGEFCLHKTKVCNGFKDCPGGEDEENDFTPGAKCRVGFRQECTKSEFRGKFGDCIPLTSVCDGKVDSWGGVDEAIDFCTWVHSDSTVNNSVVDL